MNLFGVDATLVRRDPTGGFRNTMLQAEAMYAVVDQPGLQGCDDGASLAPQSPFLVQSDPRGTRFEFSLPQAA